MRIAHVTPVFAGRGGVQTYVRMLTEALAARGHDVHVFAAGGTRGHSDRRSGVEVHWLGSGYVTIARRVRVPKSTADLRRWLAEFDGIIHAHQPFAPSTLVSAWVRHPKVLSPYVHAPQFRNGVIGARRRHQLSLVAQRFDGLVFVSKAERDSFQDLVRRRHKSEVVYPGQSWKPNGSATTLERDLVLAVGALADHKRPNVALRAAILAGVGERCRIVGEGPMAPILAELCVQAGLNPAEVLAGSISDEELAALAARARLVLALSTEESFGIALLDLIAAGAVPVASDIPSHREIIAMTGWSEQCLVPVDADAAAVSRCISAMLQEPSGVKRDGATIPTWSSSTRILERYYEAVVGTWSERTNP